MFGRLDARLQGIGRVAGFHRNFALRDDFPRIHPSIDVVHGASGHFVPGRQDLRGGVGSAVFREE